MIGLVDTDVCCFTKTVLVCLALLFASISFAKPQNTSPQNITIYSHYDTPPFTTGLNEGMNYKLATWLTHLSGGQYTFNVSVVPRLRLDRILDSDDWSGLVPWVNPAWFQDEGKTKFSWSAAIMRDENLVVSHRRRPVEYRGPESLMNINLGGILGHRYIEIEALVSAGKISRVDVVSEFQNVGKLLLGRIDAMFISRSSMNYYLGTIPEFKKYIFVAKRARGSFSRHFLMPLRAKKLSRFVNEALVQLISSSEWQGDIKGCVENCD